MKRRLGSGRMSPPAGCEPATLSSEVGSANRSATRTLPQFLRVTRVWGRPVNTKSNAYSLRWVSEGIISLSLGGEYLEWKKRVQLLSNEDTGRKLLPHNSMAQGAHCGDDAEERTLYLCPAKPSGLVQFVKTEESIRHKSVKRSCIPH